MSIKMKNVFLVLFIGFVTLGLLLAVNFSYQQFFVNRPLSATLDRSTLIEEYKIVHDNKKPILFLKLKKINNLATEFQDFLLSNDSILIKKFSMVQIYSNPNHKLIDFYQEIHPSVYEALSLGNYSDLHEKLQREAERIELTKVSLTITEDYLYLQLEDNENYLYYIFSKNDSISPKIVNNIGSDIE